MEKIDEMLKKMKMEEAKAMEEEKMNLDAEESQRILELTMQKIEKEKMQGTSAEDAIKNEKKGKVISMKAWKEKFTKATVAAVVTAATFTVLLGGAAAAKVFNLDDKFAKYFYQDRESTNQMTENTQDVNVSDTQGKVKVSVEQVIGDDYGFYTLFKVQGAKKSEDQTTFKSTSVTCKGAEVTMWDDPKWVDTKNGESSYILKVYADNVNKKDISVQLKDFGYYDTFSGKFVTLNKGKWNLNWKLDYKNDAKKIDVNEKVNVYGGEAEWKEISISPLSVSITLKETKPFKVEAGTEDMNDEFYIDFADGSRINSKYVDDMYDNTTELSLSFGKIRSLDDVVSVTFAGKTIWVNPEKAVKRELYQNAKMKFSIDMPEELSKIGSFETKKQKDFDFNKKSYVANFVANKDNVEKILFTVYKVKGNYTDSDIQKKSPFRKYLGQADGYTYMLGISEFEDEKQMNTYSELMNQYVDGIYNFFEITK